jgi:hypothetical protein
MVKIRTLLRAQSGSFSPVEIADRPEDPDYIEGAIELTVDGIEILTIREWDYVDQLWGYIVKLTHDLAAGVGEVQTTFPDQPILLSFVNRSGRLQISCKYDSVNRSAVADLDDAIRALREAATDFFGRMIILWPEYSERYNSMLERM